LTWHIKNNIELKVKDIIHESKLSFIYTGERKIKIERYYPDFINLNKKKIIEVNGDYWHNFPKVIKRDKRKLQTYLLFGYQTLVIWEHEIKKDPQKVTEKLIEFYNH
jgi:very-short-patch-repair endonuclease